MPEFPLSETRPARTAAALPATLLAMALGLALTACSNQEQAADAHHASASETTP